MRQHGGVDLVFGAHDDVGQAQRRAQRDAEGAVVVPLVGAEVDVQRHRRPGPARRLGGEERRAAARLLAQPSAGDQQHATGGDGRRQHVVDGQLDVGAVVAVVGQREAVRRLDAQHHRAGAPPRLAWDEARLYVFALQKVEDEAADLVVADRRQQRRAQSQPARAHADVGRAAADVGGEARDPLERRADVVGVQVERGAPHRDQIVCRIRRLHGVHRVHLCLRAHCWILCHFPVSCRAQVARRCAGSAHPAQHIRLSAPRRRLVSADRVSDSAL